jgi:hypothetical protein
MFLSPTCPMLLTVLVEEPPAVLKTSVNTNAKSAIAIIKIRIAVFCLMVFKIAMIYVLKKYSSQK